MQNFNYHQHTYRCGHADLDMSDEDYVLEYIKMGFKKVAFTDHCPEKNKIDKREKMRMEYIKRGEYLSSIKNLKEKYSNKIQIETGYEVEYLPGEEKNLFELKSEVNKIILGQHFIYDNNNNLNVIKLKRGESEYNNDDLIRYAEYICKAMEFGIPDIIAHPDMVMYAREKCGELEREVFNMICKCAEKNDVALEINLSDIFKNIYYFNKEIKYLKYKEQMEKLETVLYPCREFWEIATNYDVKVLYGIDAHHRGQITLFKELVQFANQLLGDEIINKLNFIENI